MAWNFKDYYHDNKDVLLRRRRMRYQADSAYRLRRQEDALSYYNRKKKRAVPVPRRIVRRGDKIYHTIGKLAELIRRDEDTIRRYHRVGILPKPSVKHARGWRLYTENQTELLERLFTRLDQGDGVTLKMLSAAAFKKWRTYESITKAGEINDRGQRGGDDKRIPNTTRARKKQ